MSPSPRWSRDWATLVPLALAAVAIGWQMVCPPLVGLADNGDFGWLTGPFGLEPRASPDERYYQFVVRMWNPGAWHRPSFLCTGLLFVTLAMLASAATFREGFDLVALGSVHALVLLGGLGLVAQALRRSGMPSLPRLGLGLLAVGLLSDTSNVAYLNSFFMTAATFVLAPWVVGTFGLLATEQGATPRGLWGAALASGLFVWSKPQLAPVGLVLALLLWRALRLAANPAGRRAARASAVALALVSLACAAYPNASNTLRRAIVRVNTYHAVFTGLLEVSPAPAEDLVELGVSPDLARYRAQSCFGEGAPDIHAEEWRGFFQKVGMARLGLFYARHPSRLTALLGRAAEKAFPDPPFWLGTHEKSAQGAPKHLGVWNRLRAHLAGSLLAALGLPLAVVALALLAWRRAKGPGPRFAMELLVALGVLAASQFVLVPVTSGLPDVGRHLYPFHLLFDWMLIAAAALPLVLLRPGRRPPG